MKTIEKFLTPGLLTFFRGIICSFSGADLLGVINYLIRRILVQNLSQTDFGFFYSMFALFNMLATFFQFGIQQVAPILTVRYIAQRQEKRINCLISFLFFVAGLTGLVLMCILFVFSNRLAAAFFKYPEAVAAIRMFTPFVLLLPLWIVLQSIPHGKKDFPVYNAMGIVQMGLILAGVCFAARQGAFSVCLAWVAGFAAAFAASAFFIFRKYRIHLIFRAVFCRGIFRQLWNLCTWITGSVTGIMLLANLDTFCLTWLSDLQEVAAYNIALPIMQIMQTVLVLPLVFLPVAVDLWQKKKYAEIRRIFYLVNALLALGSIPLVLVTRWLGSWLITLLFGAQFTSAAPALTILSGGILFYCAGQFNLNLLNSANDQKNGMFLIVAAIAADLLLNILLIPRYGFIGAAIAMAATYILTAGTTFARAFYRLRKV